MITVQSRKDLHLLNSVSNTKLKVRIVDIINNIEKIYTEKYDNNLYGGTIKYIDSFEDFQFVIPNYNIPEHINLNENFYEIQFMINDDYFHHVICEPLPEIKNLIEAIFELYI